VWIRTEGPLLRFGRRPDATVRLFCLPYAGGSAMVYRQWAAALPDTIEVVGAELPGRGTRWKEAPGGDLRAVAATLAPEVARLTDIPFVLFGHSMGALLAYELALRLPGRQPASLVLSACPAPHRLAGRPQRHRLPDAELISEIARMDGTPQAVLNDRDLMALMLRIIRADLTMFETYTATAPTPLPCSIAALCGSSDTIVQKADVSGWRDYTAAGSSLSELPGGHFFIRKSSSRIVDHLARLLAPLGADRG
jgi:medium-chain acyl-[acyl-carrier-protein] hydrolase